MAKQVRKVPELDWENASRPDLKMAKGQLALVMHERRLSAPALQDTEAWMIREKELSPVNAIGRHGFNAILGLGVYRVHRAAKIIQRHIERLESEENE